MQLNAPYTLVCKNYTELRGFWTETWKHPKDPTIRACSEKDGPRSSPLAPPQGNEEPEAAWRARGGPVRLRGRAASVHTELPGSFQKSRWPPTRFWGRVGPGQPVHPRQGAVLTASSAPVTRGCMCAGRRTPPSRACRRAHAPKLGHTAAPGDTGVHVAHLPPGATNSGPLRSCPVAGELTESGRGPEARLWAPSFERNTEREAEGGASRRHCL